MVLNAQGGVGGGGGRGARGGGRGLGRGRGRGEYFKNKYGGGGRGGRGGSQQNHQHNQNQQQPCGNNGGTYNDLIHCLQSIDGQNYPRYHDIESITKSWKNPTEGLKFRLYIGRAQSDPFSPPTKCRIVIPASTAQFPTHLYQESIQRIALGDYLHRAVYAACLDLGAHQSAQLQNNSGGGRGGGGRGGGGWSGPKGGDVQFAPPNQHVLDQTAVSITKEGNVIAQFTLALPARGRTIIASRAIDIIQRVIPLLIQTSLVHVAFVKINKVLEVESHVTSIQDQEWLRGQLKPLGLVGFVPNGAILPRASGADDRPMTTGNDEPYPNQPPSVLVPFHSPSRAVVSFTLPYSQKKISGMGIARGITLLVGGGFHGKSTLLSAIQLGIYNHVPGDGREFCVCHDSAVKIRAEDGRSVQSVDISPFIDNLPFGKTTKSFSSLDASGSTSQASNIMEALEMGSELLLVDEDTCATNFMIRDEKMMQLVATEKEPITPFVHKVKPLYTDKGVSTILVIGGSGDYFSVADHVLMMDCYDCYEVTLKAKEICESETRSSKVKIEDSQQEAFGSIVNRYPNPDAFDTHQRVAVRAQTVISYGDVDLSLAGLEQIVSPLQTETIARAMKMVPQLSPKGDKTLLDVLQSFDERIENEGLMEVLAPGQFHGGMAKIRKFELAGAMNRLRKEKTFLQK